MSDTLIFLTLIVVIVLGVLGLLLVLRSMVMLKVARWFDQYVGNEVLKVSVERLLMGNRQALEAVTSVLHVRTFLGSQAMATFFDLPWIPIYLLVVFFLHPLLGVIALIGALLLLGISIINEYALRFLGVRSKLFQQERMGRIQAALRNPEAIQGLGMMPHLLEVWGQHNQKVLQSHEDYSRRSQIFLSIARTTRLVLQVAILGTGAYLAMNGVITAGTMIVASIITAKGVAPLEQSIGAWVQFIKARQAFSQLSFYFSVPQRETSLFAIQNPRGEIRAEELYYLYPQAKGYAISNINFSLEGGEVLGVIGPTGSGKTTLAKLMVGALTPVRGSIRFDGFETAQLDGESFGKYVGFLPQDVELFSGSINANISRFQEEASEEKIIEAAKFAHCHDAILHLPNGYLTDVYSGGLGMSGGQNQRIALARAFFGNPKWLILDEPNSNLDAEGDKALVEAIREAKMRGITVVLITQKKYTLEITDKILFLDSGVIKAFGPTAPVLEKLAIWKTNQTFSAPSSSV